MNQALANLGRREALLALGERGLVKTGHISSYDPTTYTAKVLLGEDAFGNPVETGWLPIGALAVGTGAGIFAGPNIGDQVDVHFLEGDSSNGFIALRFFQPGDIGANQVPSGEVWLVHKSGSTIRQTNDGALSVADGNGNTVVLGSAGITITGPAAASIVSEVAVSITAPAITSTGAWNHAGDLNVAGAINDTSGTVGVLP